MKKIIQIMYMVFLVFLLMTLVSVIYARYIQKEPIVKLGKYAILVVLTDSMEPTIEGSELILIKEESTYQAGDIVTYRDEDNLLITHRIVEIETDTFVAKGDGNEGTDEKMALEKIEGKVIFHSKILGMFILYYLKFLIVAYIVFLLIVYLIRNMGKEKDIEEKEN